jgi:tRNA(His) 5'-end guanylyltransferase
MPIRDNLGTRMKEFYETIPKTRLMRRCPVAIRIDGKAFHTFTRGFNKPFDEVLVKSMQRTMKYLCENIQGCVFGYTQSDEITLILLDYQTLDTDAWFDYEVQKMCSIAASMATMAFNRYFNQEIKRYRSELRTEMILQNGEIQEEYKEYINTLYRSAEKGAMFDARVFNIPKEEVTNLIYWRQLDAARNSVQMVGQANFSHSELQGKSCNDIQDMLMTQKGINWNDFPTYLKRGSACIKKERVVNVEYATSNNIVATVTTRPGWEIDLDMPMLKGDDRKYLDDLIFIGE